jgi:hypothetical protein
MQVVNVHAKDLKKAGYLNLQEWLEIPGHIYIGRGNRFVKGADPSKWQNPFSVEKYGREKAMKLYEEYIRNSELLKEIKELDKCVLGCWCAPEGCHGDILVKLLKETLS